ncbi:hypothetical protein ACKWTF_016789 [Chironomus riparius]
MALAKESVSTVCPNCKTSIATEIEPRPSWKTHLTALILYCVGLVCCTCWPYIAGCCSIPKHMCPQCKAVLGEFHE